MNIAILTIVIAAALTAAVYVLAVISKVLSDISEELKHINREK